MKIMTMQIKNQEYSGGAYERYITLINSFLDEGWEVHHISPKGFSNIKHNKSFIHHGIFDISFYPNFIPFYIQTFFKMFLINQKNDINIIITFSALEAVMGIVFKFFNKKTKLIVCYQGDPISNYEVYEKGVKKKIATTFIKFIDNIVINNADLTIFVSKKNKNDILGRLKNNNVNTKVVYNGLNSRLKNLSNQNAVEWAESSVIGFVGDLSELKGLNYLIDAFNNIRSDLPDSILVIVGDGPDKYKFIKTVEDLNLNDSVIFTGYKKNPVSYMKGFDLMVVPSLSEGFGLVIIEALYVGTPVLGSKVGGIPEVLKYDELLFEVGTNELEIKILDFFKNRETQKNIIKLSENRRDAFSFNWTDKMIGEIKNLNNN